MKDDHILKFLLDWMVQSGASEAQQNEYAALWKRLGPHESRPCPRCKTTFPVPEPD